MDNTPIHPRSSLQQPGGIALVVLLVILALLLAGGAVWYLTVGTRTTPETQTLNATATVAPTDASNPATTLSEVEGDFTQIDTLESELNADLDVKDQSVSF